MNVAVLTALIEARRLINNGWSQKTFARDADGNMCDWGSQAAKSFCAIGAIYSATDWRNTCATSLCMDVLEAVAKQMNICLGDPPWMIALYNDAKGRKKEEVLDAFDKAIAAQIGEDSVAVAATKELEIA